MKKALYCVMKNSPTAFEALDELKQSGFNATVVNTESLHHALDYYPEDHHFFNLRQFERRNEDQESILCIFVGEEDLIQTVKEHIRKTTGNFSYIRGFMYTQSLEDYEGSI